MSIEPLSFGRFRLDLARRELLHDGVPVRLGSRALDILCVLGSANGEIITKDELMLRVWAGLTVEESNVHVHVSALRKALSQLDGGSSYVVTVPGRGYRLIRYEPENSTKPVLLVPDKPSIVVLPFTNLNGDREEEYFADGVVEEIIMALSRIPWLFVIARGSSFAFKGRAVDIKEVGRQLGVRYVLEGSVRKAGNRVRVMGQLGDSASAEHLWTDRFEAPLEDIFDLQDKVTSSVVGAISRRLEQAEIERATRRPTESLDAHDYYLRALAKLYQWTRRETTRH